MPARNVSRETVKRSALLAGIRRLPNVRAVQAHRAWPGGIDAAAIRPGQVRMTDRSTPPVLPGLAGIAWRTGQSVCAKVATLAGRNGGARICAGRVALPVARLPDPATIDRRCPQVPWSGARGAAKLREISGSFTYAEPTCVYGDRRDRPGRNFGPDPDRRQPCRPQTAATDPPQADPSAPPAARIAGTLSHPRQRAEPCRRSRRRPPPRRRQLRLRIPWLPRCAGCWPSRPRATSTAPTARP